MSRSTWALSSVWSWRQIWHHCAAYHAYTMVFTRWFSTLSYLEQMYCSGELWNSRWQKNWFVFFDWSLDPCLRLQQRRWKQQKREQQQSQQQLEIPSPDEWMASAIWNGRRNISNSRQGLICCKAGCFDAQCLVYWMQVAGVQDQRRRRWWGMVETWG